MADNRIEVIQGNQERRFLKCYLDFIDCDLLTGEEKIIFLILKRFLDVRADQGDVFPSLDTICRLSGMTEKTVRKHIKSLQKKGVVIVKRRGLTKSNLYVINDRRDMWKSQTIEELQTAAVETMEEKSIRYLRSIGYTDFIKEKESDQAGKPATVPTQSDTYSKNPINNPTGYKKKSQDNKPKNSFHNFSQRDYDYDELERKLSNRNDGSGRR